jgi:hypothetical protein
MAGAGEIAGLCVSGRARTCRRFAPAVTARSVEALESIAWNGRPVSVELARTTAWRVEIFLGTSAQSPCDVDVAGAAKPGYAIL